MCCTVAGTNATPGNCRTSCASCRTYLAASAKELVLLPWFVCWLSFVCLMFVSFFAIRSAEQEIISRFWGTKNFLYFLTLYTISGVVANVELWEHSEVLLPSFPFIPCPSPTILSFFSPTLPSLPLSGGNNFNDFPENKLTVDFAFLCKPAWGTLLYHRSPFLISFGGTAFPHKIFGVTTFPLDYATVKQGRYQYVFVLILV